MLANDCGLDITLGFGLLGASVGSGDTARRNMALGALRRIQKLPKLVKSFFGHNECLYARM